MLAALSFLAFLIGSLFQVRPDTIRSGVVRIVGHNRAQKLLRGIPTGGWDGKPPAVSQSSIASLDTLISEMAREADPSGWQDFMADPTRTDQVLADVTSDLRALALRLQVDKPDLFQDYDRKASEADFRVNVGLAIGALATALTIAAGNGWLAAGFLITLAMLRSGIYRQQIANDLLIETLTSRVVTCQALNKLDQNLRIRNNPRSQLP
ncbi:hypothetical protein [Kitasatospora phosalacinea]|uniref:hypothetical protein n=1 Tax=Kitasatospora phosalacinea TaxID=2065 RepID=UPI00131B5C56|nr:hypothetical protein [Kitasatospora phosalacinea]